MNASLYNLDRITHFKILAIAAIAATFVFVIGEAAQLGGTAPGRAIAAPYMAPYMAPYLAPNLAPNLAPMPAVSMPHVPRLPAPKPQSLIRVLV